jgi:hypothetical protein
MTNKRLAEVKAAARRRQLVRFTRPLEPGFVHGYVLAVGARWLLLALVGDGIRFNGFQCFRLRDIRELQIPHPHTVFVETALKKRGERLPRRPQVNIACVGELLRSANGSFPLVTIHREQVDPDVCWIGQVLEVDSRRVVLREINPDARWDHEPTEYRLSEITRVAFGGDYEDALHLVGGLPPSR